MHKRSRCVNTVQRLSACTLAVVATVGLAACGSSGSSGTSTTSGGSGGGAQSAPQGTPITVGSLAPVNTSSGQSYPGIFATLHAWAATVNKSGGLNGHPVRVWTCNTNYTPTQELACGRQAVSAGVDVIVGDNNEFENQAYASLLSDARIPDVENTGPQANGFSGSLTFPLTWQQGTFVPCVSQAMATAAGGKKVVAVENLPSALWSSAGPLFQYASKALGTQWLTPIKAAVSTTDWSSAVAQAQQSGANTVVMLLLGAAPQAFVRASSAAGAHFKICTALGLSGAGGFFNVGSEGSNVFLGADAVPTSSKTPGMKAFVAAMNAEHARGDAAASLSPKTLQDESLETWVGLAAVKQAVDSIKGPITKQAIATALKTTKFDFGGMIPNFSFGQKPKSGAGAPDPSARAYEHVWNSAAYLWQWAPTSQQYELKGSVADSFSASLGK